MPCLGFGGAVLGCRELWKTGCMYCTQQFLGWDDSPGGASSYLAEYHVASALCTVSVKSMLQHAFIRTVTRAHIYSTHTLLHHMEDGNDLTSPIAHFALRTAYYHPVLTAYYHRVHVR